MLKFIKNFFCKNLNSQICKLKTENKELNDKLLVKDVANFIRRQPSVKLYNQEDFRTCAYCLRVYNVFDVHYYIHPLCQNCEKALQADKITERELEVILENHHKMKYIDISDVREQ